MIIIINNKTLNNYRKCDINSYLVYLSGLLNRSSRISRLERLSNYDESMITRIEELISREAHARDPEVIQLVWELMDPPATSHPLKLSRSVYKTPQAEIIDIFLREKVAVY